MVTTGGPGVVMPDYRILETAALFGMSLSEELWYAGRGGGPAMNATMSF
jgi:hypothetical protein